MDRHGCPADGWTPFGHIRKAIEARAEKYESLVHHQEIIQSYVLEQLKECTFHISDKVTAMNKHKEGTLIPQNPDISIWTDGSFNKEHFLADEAEFSGAAAIIHISDPDPHSTIFDLEFHTTLQLKGITSSYEAEIIALQAGVNSLLELEPEGRHVHIFTDSLSCIQQIACLPYEYNTRMQWSQR